MKWKLIGIDFHRRWRSGRTILDLRYNSLWSHHGFYSLEWARGPHIDYYREDRKMRRAAVVSRPHQSTPEADNGN